MTKAGNELSGIKTIIFDYDGTLHDSSRNYISAFKKAYTYLAANKKAEPREWKDEEITNWLGFSSKEMWESFMPDLEPEFQQKASQMIGAEMLEKVRGKEAVLYAGALESLAYLKNSGYRLVFLSNCRENYMKAHTEAFQLGDYFVGMHCTEAFDFIPKHSIFTQIKNTYESPYLIVGDRWQDFEIGRVHHVKTIACNYGYGTEKELETADVRIDDIRELKDML